METLESIFENIHLEDFDSFIKKMPKAFLAQQLVELYLKEKFGEDIIGSFFKNENLRYESIKKVNSILLENIETIDIAINKRILAIDSNYGKYYIIEYKNK